MSFHVIPCLPEMPKEFPNHLLSMDISYHHISKILIERGLQLETCLFPKQCGNTWGSYGNGKRPGWLDRGGGRGSVRNSSLFSWFRACMFVSSVNFRSFRVAATDAHGFCL